MTIEDRKIRPMEVHKEIKVNPYDIDVMGIVSNIVYIRWMEDLRFLLLDTHYPFREMLNGGESPILRETKVEYFRPVTIHDKPDAVMWVKNVTKSRWTVEGEIIVDGKVHFRGEQTGYFFDLNRKRVSRIPNQLIEKFESEKI